MHFAQFIDINVRSLDNFNFSYLDVLHGVDAWDFLGNLFLNDLAGEEVEDLGDVGFGDLLGNNIINSFTNDFLLRWEGIVGLWFLVVWFSGESNDEDSQDISVGCSDILNGLD